jgi:molybdate transport system permease protein
MDGFAEIDWFPLWLSLRVALAATGLSLVLAIALSYLLTFKNVPGRNLIDALVTLPLALPPTVVGFGLLILLGRESWLGQRYEQIFGQPILFTFKAAVIAGCLHAAPLLTRMTRAAMESIDFSHVAMARSLGANEFRVLSKIVLPLARRGIIAATALAFARSLGDFGITIMVSGNIPGASEVISVAIYNAVESGRGDAARWLVFAVCGVALIAVLASNWIAYRRHSDAGQRVVNQGT